MKQAIVLFSLMLFLVTGIHAQNNVGIGTTNPNPNALLEVRSSSQGLMIPRMNTGQRESMVLGPVDQGLMVYDVTLDQFMFFDGNVWQGITTDTSRWGQLGDNILRLNGNVGIGITTPLGKFHVKNDEGTTAVRIGNQYTGPAVSYGLLARNESENTNDRFGILSTSYGSPGSGTLFGVAGKAETANEDMDAYGGYFFADSTGAGTHYGVYTEAKGIGNYALYANSATADGYAGYFDGRVSIVNRLGIGTDTPDGKLDIQSTSKNALIINNTSASSDTVFGIDLYVDSLSQSTRYGIRNIIGPASGNTADVYGLLSRIKNNGAGNHIAVYGFANGNGNIGVRGKSSGTGTGVYGENTDNEGFAGYFDGNTYVQDRLEIRDKIFLRPVGNGDGGEIELFDDDGDQTVTIRAGQSTTNGAEMLMYNDDGIKTIELDADFSSGKGRVITDELQITGGSDLAENFMVSAPSSDIRPGMVVCIDAEKEGALKPAQHAYDKTVVGVISGANGVDPGMLMGQQSTIADGDWPVALAGRVYVLADATNHPVRTGDLLTSATRPGYAMSARKARKAQGAILGKALTSLDEGTGYVLMLVNLR